MFTRSFCKCLNNNIILNRLVNLIFVIYLWICNLVSIGHHYYQQLVFRRVYPRRKKCNLIQLLEIGLPCTSLLARMSWVWVYVHFKSAFCSCKQYDPNSIFSYIRVTPIKFMIENKVVNNYTGKQYFVMYFFRAM